MIEYWIPTQNIHYSVCDPINSSNQCGYSNVLQFDVSDWSSNNSADIGSGVWFTEQSENKIGFIDLDKVIPISLSVNPKAISLSNGNHSTESIEISVNFSNPTVDFQKQILGLTNNSTILFKPTVSGTFVPNEDLIGLQVSFDPEIYEIKLQQKIDNETTHLGKINTTLRETRYIPPGNYSLTIGLEGQDFFYLKESRTKYLRFTNSSNFLYGKFMRQLHI